jgi:hypothetical protein
LVRSVFAVVLALIGLVLAAGGAWLAVLGGSWYYLIAGVLLVVSGVLIFRRRFAGIWLFALGFAGTLVWSFAEVGVQFWPLVPRLSPWIVLGVVTALIAPGLRPSARGASRMAAAALAVVGIVGFAQMFSEHGAIVGAAPLAPVATGDARAQQGERWQYYGRTLDGHRFAPFDQITRDNVGKLQVAWTFRTGDVTGKGAEDQSTPTQVGDSVYICTPTTAYSRSMPIPASSAGATTPRRRTTRCGTAAAAWPITTRRPTRRRIRMRWQHASSRAGGHVCAAPVPGHHRCAADRAGCSHRATMPGLRQGRRGGPENRHGPGAAVLLHDHVREHGDRQPHPGGRLGAGRRFHR